MGPAPCRPTHRLLSGSDHGSSKLPESPVTFLTLILELSGRDWPYVLLLLQE